MAAAFEPAPTPRSASIQPLSSSRKLISPSLNGVTNVLHVSPPSIVRERKPLFGHIRRRDVIPGDAAIIRAGNLRLGHTPAVQFAEELNLKKRRSCDQRRVDPGRR